MNIECKNVSYVFSTIGRRWVTGLKPAKNVGARVASEIESIINKREGNVASSISAFAANVAAKRAKNPSKQPTGNKNPKKSESLSTHYDRDPDVVAWVLEEAICSLRVI